MSRRLLGFTERPCRISRSADIRRRMHGRLVGYCAPQRCRVGYWALQRWLTGDCALHRYPAKHSVTGTSLSAEPPDRLRALQQSRLRAWQDAFSPTEPRSSSGRSSPLVHTISSQSDNHLHEQTSARFSEVDRVQGCTASVTSAVPRSRSCAIVRGRSSHKPPLGCFSGGS